MTNNAEAARVARGRSIDAGCSDVELSDAVRGGDVEAYGILWSRHEAAVRAYAASLRPSYDVDELVSEAFLQTLAALLKGNGPRTAFRTYVTSTVRYIHIKTCKRYYWRFEDNDENLEGSLAEPPADGVVIEHSEHVAAWRAWESLNADDRQVLWASVIQGEPRGAVADRLGISENATSVRVRRAKERLRHAYLNQQIRKAETEECAKVRERLPRLQLGRLPGRLAAPVRAHLAACSPCADCALEVEDISSRMRAAVPLVPFLMGSSGTIWEALHRGADAGGAGKIVAGGSGAHAWAPQLASVGKGLAALGIATAVTFGAIAAVSHHGGSGQAPPGGINVGARAPGAFAPAPQFSTSATSSAPAPAPTPAATRGQRGPVAGATSMSAPPAAAGPEGIAASEAPTDSSGAPAATATRAPTRPPSSKAPTTAPRQPQPSKGTTGIYLGAHVSGWEVQFTAPTTWAIASVTGPSGTSCVINGQTASCLLGNGAVSLTLTATPIGPAVNAAVQVKIIENGYLVKTTELPLTLA
ncbi:MAG: sigma-70 family RNA polymerase sigma factor [Actinomycetia bacterium]|nr:sigma-70 family RNA polymerase sigma factor [Actinomycetes bacterium]